MLKQFVSDNFSACVQIQIRASGGNAGDEIEKMELYQTLERAEGRIAALENQVG